MVRPAPPLREAWRRALAVLLLVLGLAASAHAQTFPKFTGLVVDAADVIPADQRAALEARLQALQQQTKAQLVVATIPDLQGYDIADYGYRLGRAWGVGLKGGDNGAILLVAPKERKVRVEVGYGLEGTLTDAFSSLVIQQDVLPRFKAGDMPGGIVAGADAIAAQLRLPDDQAQAKAAAAAQAYDKAHKRGAGGGFPIGLLFWLVLIAAFLGLRWFGRGRGGTSYRGPAGGPGGGGSNWPIWLWAASEFMGDRHRGGGGFLDGGGGAGSGGPDGSWTGGGFTGGGGGSFGGGGASGDW